MGRRARGAQHQIGHGFIAGDGHGVNGRLAGPGAERKGFHRTGRGRFRLTAIAEDENPGGRFTSGGGFLEYRLDRAENFRALALGAIGKGIGGGMQALVKSLEAHRQTGGLRFLGGACGHFASDAVAGGTGGGPRHRGGGVGEDDPRALGAGGRFDPAAEVEQQGREAAQSDAAQYQQHGAA